MRKAMDAEQRETMLYLADLGTAVFSSALIVCVLRVVGDLIVGRHKVARYTGLLEPGPRVPFAQLRIKRLASAQHLRRYPVRCGSGPPALIGRTNSIEISPLRAGSCE